MSKDALRAARRGKGPPGANCTNSPRAYVHFVFLVISQFAVILPAQFLRFHGVWGANRTTDFTKMG
jgi:hypothetical protein